MLSRARDRERRNLQPPGALKLEGWQHGRKHFPILTLATGPSHMSSTLILLSAKDHFLKNQLANNVFILDKRTWLWDMIPQKAPGNISIPGCAESIPCFSHSDFFICFTDHWYSFITVSAKGEFWVNCCEGTVSQTDTFLSFHNARLYYITVNWQSMLVLLAAICPHVSW